MTALGIKLEEKKKRRPSGCYALDQRSLSATQFHSQLVRLIITVVTYFIYIVRNAIASQFQNWSKSCFCIDRFDHFDRGADVYRTTGSLVKYVQMRIDMFQWPNRETKPAPSTSDRRAITSHCVVAASRRVTNSRWSHKSSIERPRRCGAHRPRFGCCRIPHHDTTVW